jgi:hypothetical protein
MKILLKVKSGSGCCGGKSTISYLVIEVVKRGQGYFLQTEKRPVSRTSLLKLAKENGTWENSVTALNLHKREKFLSDLLERGILKRSETIIL